MPRIDEPGLIYHVIARGIERRRIFNDREDNQFFLSRVGKIVSDTDMQVCTFALMPNHFHLLLRRSSYPVSSFMQRLLTSYAMYFNRKNQRTGHLFQNRYRAILCNDDRHFLELVRYIHLNPLRAGLVRSLAELERYPYSGHGFIMGRVRRGWFDSNLVRAYFGMSDPGATNAYQAFIAQGLMAESDCRPDENRLPGSTFSHLEQGVCHAPAPKQTSLPSAEHARLFADICTSCSVTEAELLSPTRRRNVAAARAVLAYRLSKEIGLSGTEIGRRLHVTRSAVSKMINKGSELHPRELHSSSN